MLRATCVSWQSPLFCLTSHTELLMHLHRDRWEASRCLLGCVCVCVCFRQRVFVLGVFVDALAPKLSYSWLTRSPWISMQCYGSWWQFLIWLQCSLTSRRTMTYILICERAQCLDLHACECVCACARKNKYNLSSASMFRLSCKSQITQLRMFFFLLYNHMKEDENNLKGAIR